MVGGTGSGSCPDIDFLILSLLFFFLRFRLGIWKLKGARGLGIGAAMKLGIGAASGVRLGHMPPMRGGGDRITSTVEISRNTEVEEGAPEEKMATYQRGSSNQEIRTVKKAAELRLLGTFAYNIKYK
jgi:hypothetical protein